MHEVQPIPLLNDQHPNYTFWSVNHKVDSVQTDQVTFIVIKLSTENLALEKVLFLGFLEETNITMEQIITESV